MTKKIVMTMVLVGMLGACGSSETAPAPEAPAPAPAAAPAPAPAPAPAAPAAPAAEAAPSGGATVCARAHDCCIAYVDALGGAASPAAAAIQSACSALEQQQGVPGMDAACQSQIDGWRTSLQAMQHEVPAACQ